MRNKRVPDVSGRNSGWMVDLLFTVKISAKVYIDGPRLPVRDTLTQLLPVFRQVMSAGYLTLKDGLK